MDRITFCRMQIEALKRFGNAEVGVGVEASNNGQYWRPGKLISIFDDMTKEHVFRVQLDNDEELNFRLVRPMVLEFRIIKDRADLYRSLLRDGYKPDKDGDFVHPTKRWFPLWVVKYNGYQVRKEMDDTFMLDVHNGPCYRGIPESWVERIPSEDREEC